MFLSYKLNTNDFSMLWQSESKLFYHKCTRNGVERGGTSPKRGQGGMLPDIEVVSALWLSTSEMLPSVRRQWAVEISERRPEQQARSQSAMPKAFPRMQHPSKTGHVLNTLCKEAPAYIVIYHIYIHNKG
jgi:hypothetical protein